jgi:hypothetical protein
MPLYYISVNSFAIKVLSSKSLKKTVLVNHSRTDNAMVQTKRDI